MKTAHLFIDESGDFSTNDRLVVGGILLLDLLPEHQPRALYQSLVAVAPMLPWPLHAASYNIPVSLALSAISQSQSKKNPFPVNPTSLKLAEAVVDILAQYEPEVLSAVMQDFAAQREAKFAHLVTLDRELGYRDDDLYRRLENHSRRVHAGLKQVIESLVAPPSAPDRRPACLGFFATEALKGDTRHPARRRPEAPDRYLSLLTLVLDRASSVVARGNLADELRVRVLGRWVRDEVLDKNVALHSRHLSDIANRYLRGPGRPRVIFDTVARYDEDVHPLLVLADFASNAARRTLNESSMSLGLMEAHIELGLGAPLRHPAVERSNLAASGLAFEYAVGGPSEEDVSWKRCYLWAREQAKEWREEEPA